VNQNNQDCIDWVQVLDAGKGGFFGAIDSEATLIASIPLAPLYLVSAIVYQKSPVEVNATLLSHFGLDDEYSAAYSNPYYVAGKGGGSAAGTYISLATFLKGLPTIVGNFGNKIGKGGVLVLSVEGMSVVGGSGELVYVGTAGFSASFFSLGPENKAQGQWGEAQARELLEKSGLEILGEEVNIQVSGGRRIVDFLVRDSKGKIYAVEVKTGNAQLTQHQITLDNLMRTQGGVIRSQKVPVEFNNLRLDSIEMIYFRFPNPP
jgi:Holliday junction resolvase-like predicted endonuclease